MKRYIDCINRISNHVVEVKPLSIYSADQAVLFDDARSAAFYAMGLAVKEQEPVILLVPGDYLSSTYTAITEAWFQKANVIVLALFSKVSDVKTAWMDRCVINTMTVGIEESDLIEAFVEDNVRTYGPSLVNIVYDEIACDGVDYSGITSCLKDKTIIIYNDKSNVKDSIPARYKYGLLSRYIGMSSVHDAGVLLCTADCVFVDVNIFRTRYANVNMKIIILDDGSLIGNGIDHWIKSNGWYCAVTDKASIETALPPMMESEQAAVLIVKEG